MYTELKNLIKMVEIIKTKLMVKVYTYTNLLIQVKNVWNKPSKNTTLNFMDETSGLPDAQIESTSFICWDYFKDKVSRNLSQLLSNGSRTRYLMQVAAWITLLIRVEP